MQKMTWVGAALVLSAAPAFAQFDNAWVTYENQTSSRLVAASGLGALDTEEKDYAVGDFDRDGWTDLVVVRKQPFTTAGKRAGVLFMN